MALSKEQILGIVDIEVKEIDVPSWGGSVYIRQLSRGQQDEYLKRRIQPYQVEMKGGAEQELKTSMLLYGHDAWLVVQGVCDEEGKRLFSDSDIKKLDEKNGEVIGKIASEIVEFSGFGKDVEEIEDLKN